MANAALVTIPLTRLDGVGTSLAAYDGNAILVVNVASKCGLTPQYAGLEQLAEEYGPRGLTVLGVPCNQFAGQEPGSAEEIATFCSTTYGVTFPLLEKTDVNGDGRHPLYVELAKVKDDDGEAGDVQWNFEKFLIASDGSSVRRFRPRTEPTDPVITAAIEDVLPTAVGGLTRARDKLSSRAVEQKERHVARVIVDVMPKPEILDPQGQAITGALGRLGYAGVGGVRQGKRFELEVDDSVDDADLEKIASELLANTVIEEFHVSRVS